MNSYGEGAGHEHGSRKADLVGVRVGPGYLYRSGEVLLDPRDERRVGSLLRDAGGTVCPSSDDAARAGLRLQRSSAGWSTPASTSLRY